MTRDNILDALGTWINQRPGLDYRNYISHGRDEEGRRAYNSEVARIGRQLRDARLLLSAVRARPSIDVERLRAAFRAYSGRLQLIETDAGGCKLNYCTGQYWPTEYRAAACAVLASALWDWTRDLCMPAPVSKGQRHGFETELYKAPGGRPGLLSAGDWIRKSARLEFGASIQQRWFN